MNIRDVITKARSENRTALDEFAGKQLLASFGISVPRAAVIKGADEAAAAFAKLTAPLVLKIMSPDILHKSDAGGVKVNLKSAAETADAVRGMMNSPVLHAARIDGFLLEEMAPGGQEVVVGAVRDPQFGPLVMVGLGGIFVELLADVAFRICPITRLDAREMLAELKGAAILKGARGHKPASLDAITDVLLKIGGEGGLLARHADDFSEADINPLIVSESGAVAVDARFVLS